MKRVLIWGLGAEYSKCINLLRYYHEHEFEIVGITDRDLTKRGIIDGFTTIPLTELDSNLFDYIVVMSEKYYHEIREHAMRRTAISGDRIFPCRVLYVPYFDFNALTEISESHYSFVSNNCWGGVLCYTLGIECRSPFKNLSLADDDFIKLIKDFRGYMDMEPKWEDDWEVDTNSGKRVPLLYLGNIKIKCNHYPDPHDAIEKWNSRKKKINYNNIFVEMYTETIHSAQQFDQTDTRCKKICFVPFETNLKSCVTLRKMTGQKKFYETVNGAVDLKAGCRNYNIFSLFENTIEFRDSEDIQ